MVWGRRLIVQQGERGILRDDDHIGSAVVVQVADGQSTPQPGESPGGPGAVRDVDELAPTVAEEQLRGHQVGERGAVVVDMAVGLRQVEAPVVVGIERGEPEAEHEPGRRGERGRGRSVAEPTLAVIVIERGRFAQVVGDGQVEPAVAVEVSTGHAHARQIATVGAGRQARLLSLLGEPEAALVAEEKVGCRVVGHEQVDLAVVIEVGRDNPQAASLAVDDARLLGHVEKPAAVVAKDMIRERRQQSRVAIPVVAAIRMAQSSGLTASHFR